MAPARAAQTRTAAARAHGPADRGRCASLRLRLTGDDARTVRDAASDLAAWISPDVPAEVVVMRRREGEKEAKMGHSVDLPDLDDAAAGEVQQTNVKTSQALFFSAMLEKTRLSTV